jgi:hypothetical protein
MIAMNFYTQSDNPETEPAPRTSLWHRARPGAGDRHTTLLFWLTVLGLGCVSLLAVTWGASNVLAQKGSEKLLRVDLLFPKLKSIHGEWKASAFHMSEPKPSELAHPKDRKTSALTPLPPMVIDHPTASFVEPVHHDGPEPPRQVSANPGLHLIPQVELTPPPVETCHDPIIYLQQCSPHRGDSPMIHNWKTLTMYSLLTAAAVTFVPQPALIFADEKKAPALEVKALEELQKSINELVKRIDTLEKKKAPALDMDALTDVIRTEIRAELKKFDSFKADLATVQSDHVKHKLHIETQKAQLDKLTEEISGLRKQLTAGSATPSVDKAFMEETRSSLKAINDTIAKMGPTKERLSMSPANGTTSSGGRVMIVNLYSDDLLFLINGKAYRVPAGRSQLLDNIPVGAVQYRVHSSRWGTLVDQSTTLLAGETFTLTAADQK